MRIVLFLALLAAATLSTTAQTSSGTPAQKTEPAAKQESVERDLTKLDRELMDAAVKNDEALLNRTALDSYVFINPGGGVEEKGQPGPMAKFQSLEPADVKVRVNGDT